MGVRLTSNRSESCSWRRTVPGLDARNPYLTVKGGTRNPLVSLVVREICSNNAPGSVVGMTYRVYAGKKFVKVGQTSVPLGKDCTVAVRPVYRFAKGKTYTMIFIMNTYNGVIVQRTATIATT